ncbi:MAG: xanthine dehydrogenase family protein molybdopterin-binding subunit [Rhodocyclaceae bacterium]|nr:xanthine dehydrogenase family protein molybdopterin-binding subunit [Rhodocyclaceae bacterium]
MSGTPALPEGTNLRTRAIGQPTVRAEARRFVTGAGAYVDDLPAHRLLHAAFLRSPVAHGTIVKLDLAPALRMEGVVAAYDGEALAPHCQPVRGLLAHLPDMQAALQWPLARDRVRWVGEPVALVIAESRALAEDAAQAIAFEWTELPPMVDPRLALEPDAPRLHAEFDSNLMFAATVATANVEQAFAQAGTVVELAVRTERVTAMALEPRGLLAQWDAAQQRLTVHMGTQVPWMMQAVFASVLGIGCDQVRVVAADTGGSFGSKIHCYGDESAVAVAAKHLGRPIRYVADRLEAFVSDVHARGHEAVVRAAVDADGRLTAFEVDDLCGAGPFSIYPRGSVNESRHVLGLTGACYRATEYRARIQVAMQTKAIYGQYRGVGHPLACLFTEAAVDAAARQLGVDPLAFRRRNLVPDDAYPHRAPSGARFESLSLCACLDELARLMDYDRLRADQRERAADRERGVYRGIGLAVFVENSNHSSSNYGRGGAPIASRDGAMIRLTQGGGLHCAVGLTDSGQGVTTALAQIAADAVGAAMADVRVFLGDTEHTPVSGGNWGSRGTGISGEALWQAGVALRAQLVEAAAALHACSPGALELVDGTFLRRDDRACVCTLQALAEAIYFRPERFPRGFQPEPAAQRHYAQTEYDGIYTNGASASWVEVDTRTGFVKVLGHWIVDDCGTVINPRLLDEQLRGAAVQGIGQALFEGCLYGNQGELRNATLADYLVPMAAEMPDIHVGHVTTPTATSALGAKGGAEAGITGALASVVNAINDALAPLGAQVLELPVTPERVLRAIGAIDG